MRSPSGLYIYNTSYVYYYSLRLVTMGSTSLCFLLLVLSYIGSLYMFYTGQICSNLVLSRRKMHFKALRGLILISSIAGQLCP